jgi:hypothetical protein
MHQSHNIPWGVFAEHTKFVACQPSFSNRPPQLLSRGKLGQAKALNHFVQKFISTLEEFSKTERKKYRLSSEFTFPTSGDLFSDDFKSKNPALLNRGYQNIESWIRPAKLDGHCDIHEKSFSVFDWERIAVITALISENDMDTLLMLANHPNIPLQTLFSYASLAHEQTGLFKVMETTVSAYLFFNITSATGDLDNGNWKRMAWYVNRMHTPSPDWDYPADKITHRGSWNAVSASGYGSNAASDDHHPDYETLHEDLKRDFELMYRWDMLLREMGKKSPWQAEIVRILGTNIGGLNVCASSEALQEDPWAIPTLFC